MVLDGIKLIMVSWGESFDEYLIDHDDPLLFGYYIGDDHEVYPLNDGPQGVAGM
jgi:hypothetical protein